MTPGSLRTVTRKRVLAQRSLEHGAALGLPGTLDPQQARSAARERAAAWCDDEASRWRITGASMLAHAARRCRPWGWGEVRLICFDSAAATAELEVTLPALRDEQSSRVLVGLLEGWFAGTMEWVVRQQGREHATRARLQSAHGGRCMLLLR